MTTMPPPHAATAPTPPTSSPWGRMLAAVPCRNRAAAVERLEGGRLRLSVRRQPPRYLVPPLSWVIRPRFIRHYELDAMGAALWEACDDRRNVEALVDEFAARHRLSFHEARVAVSEYLHVLVARGAVAVALPPAVAPSASAASEGR